MEAALFNVQQIKHGFSKSNDACQGAILPAILNALAASMTESMTKKEKLAILQSRLPEFKEMLSSFMSGKEDEEHIIYLVA